MRCEIRSPRWQKSSRKNIWSRIRQKWRSARWKPRRDETASGYHHLKDEAVEIETQMAEIKEEKLRIQEELNASVKQEQELNDRIEKNQKALKEEQANLTEQKQRFENVHLKAGRFPSEGRLLKAEYQSYRTGGPHPQ